MLRTFILLIPVVFSSFDVWGAVLNKNGTPLPEVTRIFEKFTPDLGPTPSLAELNKIAQKDFLRPAKTERLSKKAIEHYKALCSPLSLQDQNEIIDDFRKIGDIEAVYPLYSKPNYILIQGSTISSLRERIMFLASLVETEKIALLPESKIVFLMGDRDLFDYETKAVLLNPAPFKERAVWQKPEKLPANECDLGELAWEQLDLPSPLREKTPIFVRAAKKPDAPRAQTEDTVREFLEKNNLPKKSRFLVISGNPFVYYQKKVTELMFKKLGYSNKGFSFESVGDGADVNKYNKCIAIGMLMDNLARTLYTETKFIE
ncbi:MAG: hypothetical protein H0X26_03855 [Alphaproteobacteria bacterium]|nr:hypothetical protein [Alphaproteobacteria bacterium]